MTARPVSTVQCGPTLLATSMSRRLPPDDWRGPGDSMSLVILVIVGGPNPVIPWHGTCSSNPCGGDAWSRVLPSQPAISGAASPPPHLQTRRLELPRSRRAFLLEGPCRSPIASEVPALQWDGDPDGRGIRRAPLGQGLWPHLEAHRVPAALDAHRIQPAAVEARHRPLGALDHHRRGLDDRPVLPDESGRGRAFDAGGGRDAAPHLALDLEVDHPRPHHALDLEPIGGQERQVLDAHRALEPPGSDAVE